LLRAGRKESDQERKNKKEGGEMTLTPVYLLQYSAIAPSSLSVNDTRSRAGWYINWCGSAGNGFCIGVEGVLSSRL